jgi:hypothetical protein
LVVSGVCPRAGTHGNTEGHHAPVSGLTEFLGAPSLRV